MTTKTDDMTVAQMAKEATDRGASGAFVACVVTDIAGRHIAREAVRTAVRQDSDVVGGGFITALSDGETGRAWARADAQSKRLMDAAGVAEGGR